MSEYVRYVKQLAKPVAPRLSQLDIELTERCNNNCIHCCINLPVNDRQAKQLEMTSEQVKEYLQQAADLGCLTVRFTGGEPLLRTDFEEVYLYARRLGLKVQLFTNARLITRRVADLFSGVPPLELIEVTVYGMHKESYEAVTRKMGSFVQFWSGVNRLLDQGIPFLVKSCILPENKSDMGEFESWAGTIPWMQDRPGYTVFFDLRSRCNNTEKNQQIKLLRPSPQEGLALLEKCNADYYTELRKFASKFMGPQADKLFQCGASAGSLCIDAYGCLQPCMNLRSPELTIQGEKPFNALVHFSHLSKLRASNPDYLERCGRCFLHGLCEQCPAKSWSETGSLDTPIEYVCQVAHLQARRLGLLVENEFAWEVLDWRERIARA
ncbi:MAG: radical SAM protein [Anaerolineaceae bacterium]|nr:radical SAM protein [Anaerolineaceae bacterium]